MIPIVRQRVIGPCLNRLWLCGYLGSLQRPVLRFAVNMRFARNPNLCTAKSASYALGIYGHKFQLAVLEPSGTAWRRPL